MVEGPICVGDRLVMYPDDPAARAPCYVRGLGVQDPGYRVYILEFGNYNSYTNEGLVRQLCARDPAPPGGPVAPGAAVAGPPDFDYSFAR